MSTTKFRQEAQDKVDRFNVLCPVGSPVDVRLDSGALKRTTVRFPATVSSSCHAVVWLNGVRGYYLTDRVSKAEESV